MSSGKKKIKIELEDSDGGKYNLSLEGNLSKDKIQKVLQLVESLNISKDEETVSYSSLNVESEPIDSSVSIGSRIWSLIENNFSFSSFTSSNVVESYEACYGDRIQLSLVSTYLSRFNEKNKLIRSKRGKEWVYKLIKVPKLDVASSTSNTATPTTSQLDHLENSRQPDTNQLESDFLRQNALTTVYDLRL